MTTLTLSALAAVVVCLWLTQLRWPGALMEEGMMLDLPLRVLHGAIPYRSFAYFYGPISLWLPAAAYSVLGATLAVERLVGAVYLLALGWPLYVIGRRSSNALGIAMASGAMLVAQFSGVGLSALPEAGGLGFCLLGLAVGTSERAGRAPDLAAGLCFAVAADLRPDCAVWGGLLLMALVLGKKRGPLSVAAFAAGLFPYVIVVLTAGLGYVWESLVVDALRVPAERHVPLLVAESLVLLVAGLLLLVTITVLRGLPRKRSQPQALAALALTALSWLSIPEFLQRADLTHLASPASVAVGCAPLACFFAMSKRRGPGGYALGALIAGLTALVVLSFLVDLGLPTYRLQLAKIPVSYPVTNHGRAWEYASGDQALDISRVVTATDRLRPGHPNLLVGTQDLSRTPYVDDSFVLPASPVSRGLPLS